tara:strand:- start:84 stop:812 length:729 start_codon:yes stop_codon:yes gene_type:complete
VRKWDAGQKTFCSYDSPDVFAYCGDAFFPPAIIRQALDIAVPGCFWGPETTSDVRHKFFTNAIRSAMKAASDSPAGRFTIFHGSRDGEGMNCKFKLWKTVFSMSDKKVVDNTVNFDDQSSCIVEVDGSGQTHIKNAQKKWQGTDAEGTSRSTMWSFCESLRNKQDPQSGGAPQIVGIWRKFPGKRFGVIWDNDRIVAGAKLESSENLKNFLWFNDLFERCDGETGKKLPEAARHPQPNKAPA